ncbi:protein MAK16 [Nematocida sp. AWRm80]|nr:protein MAK16 [Nematocida sp. AWRm80]
MKDDQSIWNTIGQKGRFCSFKMSTETETLCRNANNVAGICCREMCPLANSKYATVREIKNKLYLLLKEPERMHKPNQIYEKIELDTDYSTALKQIEANLKGYSKKIVHKVKQRHTKLTDYLERKALIDQIGRPNYIPRKRKAERQDKAREIKAAKAAKIEQAIEKEILERYKLGIYENRSMVEQAKTTPLEEKRQRAHLIQTHGIKYVTEFEEDQEEKPKKKQKKKQALNSW